MVCEKRLGGVFMVCEKRLGGVFMVCEKRLGGVFMLCEKRTNESLNTLHFVINFYACERSKILLNYNSI